MKIAAATNEIGLANILRHNRIDLSPLSHNSPNNRRFVVAKKKVFLFFTRVYDNKLINYASNILLCNVVVFYFYWTNYYKNRTLTEAGKARRDCNTGKRSSV